MTTIKSSLYRRTGLAALILVLSATLINSLRIGLSSIYNTIAESELERWPNKPERITDEWSIVESNLSISNKLYADNPSVALNLGRLYQYKDLTTALNFYSESAKLRPSQGQTWALIAGVKSELNEIDANFSNTLSNAAAWGPREPNVQYLMVNAGLRAWPSMDQDDRLLIRQTAIRGMLSPRNRNSMAQLLKHYGFLLLVCVHLPKTPQYLRYCKTK